MKICNKCTNFMTDNMYYCPNCGAEYNNSSSHVSKSLAEKLNELYNSDLVLKAYSVSWYQVHCNEELASKLIKDQNQKCHKAQELIVSILSDSDIKNLPNVEQKVYTFVLMLCIELCQEATQMLGNYFGYQTEFERGDKLVRMGQMKATEFLPKLHQSDLLYQYVCAAQAVNTWELKEKLDETVIHKTQELQHLTFDLAKAFNEMVLKKAKRSVDFFFSPATGFIEQTWNMYLGILKGLPMSAIDNLDESGWKMLLDDQEKNHNGRQYKQEFIAKRDKQRNEQRNAELDIADKQYGLTHPLEYKQIQENKNRIAQKQAAILSLSQEVFCLKSDIATLTTQIAHTKSASSEITKTITKLKRKIFGKKKAVATIQQLNVNLTEHNQSLSNLEEQLQSMEQSISTKERQKQILDRDIHIIEQTNADLRKR